MGGMPPRNQPRAALPSGQYSAATFAARKPPIHNVTYYRGS
jgi:hypothetical protein